MDRKSKGHYCVDYCQPPEHADLCHSNIEWRNQIGAHQEIEELYWRLYRVVVTKVQRLPELDGDKPTQDLGIIYLTTRAIGEYFQVLGP